MKESQTLVADAPTAALDPCPKWCTNPNCGGEHGSDSLTASATGDEPETASVNGATFPAVSVHASWPSTFGQPLAVCLHIGSSRMDAEVFLRPAEAEQLVGHLQAVLGQIVGSER
jgi:hypothetical protein